MKVQFFLLAAMFQVIFITQPSFAQIQKSSLAVGITISGESSSSQQVARYTCGAAKMKVSLAGYDLVGTSQCKGSIYIIDVQTDQGKSPLGFDSRTGKIVVH